MTPAQQHADALCAILDFSNVTYAGSDLEDVLNTLTPEQCDTTAAGHNGRGTKFALAAHGAGNIGMNLRALEMLEDARKAFKRAAMFADLAEAKRRLIDYANAEADIAAELAD